MNTSASSCPHLFALPPRSPLPPAFTLVELLVAIAIIGILSALFLPVLVGDKEKAQGKRTV